MAKVTLGSVVTDIRGSISGNVFSRNAGGNIIRARKAPVNRNTPAQAAARASLSATSKSWAALTPQQQAAWNQFAASYPIPNVLGAAKITSGFACFVGLNTVLAKVGATAITDPPQNKNVDFISTLSSFAADSGSQVIQFQIDEDNTPSDSEFYVWCTPSLSQGKTPSKDKYRFVGAYGPESSAPYNQDISADYLRVFAPLVAGLQVRMAYATVNTTTGVTTPYQQLGIVIT